MIVVPLITFSSAIAFIVDRFAKEGLGPYRLQIVCRSLVQCIAVVANVLLIADTIKIQTEVSPSACELFLVINRTHLAAG